MAATFCSCFLFIISPTFFLYVDKISSIPPTPLLVLVLDVPVVEVVSEVAEDADAVEFSFPLVMAGVLLVAIPPEDVNASAVDVAVVVVVSAGAVFVNDATPPPP